MANPKIVFTLAGGGEQTLTFAFPPQQQPGYFRSAVRHDNVSTAGIRESVLERTDEFLELSLAWIRAGSNLAAWQAFLDQALTGASFSYYPDAGQLAFANYILEDTETKLVWKTPGVYTVSLKLRKLVT